MEYRCVSCGKEISREEFENCEGYCSDCFEFEQQEDDYEMEE